MYYFQKSFILLCLPAFLSADVNRFLEPISLKPKTHFQDAIYGTVTSAAISSSNYKRDLFVGDYSDEKDISTVTLSRQILESKLGELISYRYQATGKVKAFITRNWKPYNLSSNFILKIRDCIPDQLCPSTFIRFSIWDRGQKIGDFAEPVRLSHFVDAYCTKNLLSRGSKLSSTNLKTRSVDVLKQHTGAVPAGSILNGYELGTNLHDNSVLKWNHLKKVALVKKGEVVDVFASGTGIYITMKGMALENGVEGGFVKVRNLSSDKEFQAKVLNEKSVKVQL